MTQRVYHFTCKECGHEYLHNNECRSLCPNCGTLNQTDKRLNK